MKSPFINPVIISGGTGGDPSIIIPGSGQGGDLPSDVMTFLEWLDGAEPTAELLAEWYDYICMEGHGDEWYQLLNGFVIPDSWPLPWDP